jgi:SAM-dependent methyltransferase
MTGAGAAPDPPGGATGCVEFRCPLCGGVAAGEVRRLQGRAFHDCPSCGLLHLRASDRLDAETERARYATHDNDPDDPRYRAFLDRLAAPLTKRLSPGAEGLDFGCGPGPALVHMLNERGFPTVGWDPFFAADPWPLDRRWDFVTATEVLEHLYDPAGTLDRIARLVLPGGWFGVMTGIVTPEVEDSLESWWYARDVTHVALYRPRTMAWIGERYGWEMERVAETVVLYRAPAAGSKRGEADPGAITPTR